MLKTQVLLALRSLRRTRGYAVLNVAGLALGMMCVILIALFVRDELVYDRYHPAADRIVWVTGDVDVDGQLEQNSSSQGVVAPTLVAALPSVEAAVRIIGAGERYTLGDRTVREKGIVYADPDLFRVFDGLRLLRGDAETALAAPGQIVVTESLAARLFGTADPMGRTMDGENGALTVTGVLADLPAQSTLRLDGAVSLATAPDPGWWYENWHAFAFDTYVRLREGASVDAFRASLPGVVERHAGEAEASAERPLALVATPLLDVHLRADRPAPNGTAGNETTVLVFALVALFVLMLACVNFTNLATARSLERAREVGVRKTLGAARGGLAVQFLVEAILLSTLSLAVALVLVVLALPAMEAVTQRTLALGDLGVWSLALVGLVVATGVLAGAYPAFVLSRFRPADVLRGTFATGRQGAAVRRALVVLQFSVTAALLVGTAVVYSQLRYMQSRDLGFGDREAQLIALDLAGDEGLSEHLDAFKDRLASVPGVTGVTSSMSIPSGMHASAGGAIERADGSPQDVSVEIYLADAAFADVYGLDLVAGRLPRPAEASDESAEYVVNEATVRLLGETAPEMLLGRSAGFWGMPGTIVGVLRDFHTQGLQQPVEPLGLATADMFQNIVTVRVPTGGVAAALAGIETVWSATAPGLPFEPQFVDEAFGRQYDAERRFGRLFVGFAALAVAIACLGLFGLAAHAAAQRRKEIGVRRVLGATVLQVVSVLTRDMLGVVLVAVALGVPAALFWMERWLDGFAVRAPIGWEVAVFAGGAVLTVALATVAGQALRAAAADPVHALRSD